MKKKVGVVLYPGCIFFELALALELLAQDSEVFVFTPDGEEFSLNNHLKIFQTFSYRNFESVDLDCLLIPGGDAESIFENSEIDKLLKNYWDKNILIGAICFGPMLLAKSGLLLNKTIAHGLEQEQKDFLKDILSEVMLSDERLVHDGQLVTAKPWAHIDFAVEIANRLGVIDIRRVPFYKNYYRGYPQGMIRPLALAVIDNNKKQFLFHEGFDSVKKEYFYRPLGGGIEFGEAAVETIRREFLEEIRAEVTVLESLGFYENIFEYEGKRGHEFIVIHKAIFADPTLGNKEYFDIVEAGRVIGKAVWRSLSEIKSQGAKIYPLGIEEKLS